MTDKIFHFGKHKGKPLSDVPENYLKWVIHEHSDPRAIEAAVLEMDRRGTEIIESGGKRRAKAKGKRRTPSSSSRTNPARKSQNERSTPKRKKQHRRSSGRSSPKKPAVQKTHYEWTDEKGVKHITPNDVDLQGRENEQPPF